MLEGFISGLFNGISIGAVLLIAALGLAIVFGLMGVINLAHGELMMLGAYTTYVVQNSLQDFEAMQGLYVFVALPVAFIVAALAGLVLERGVIRYLYGRPLETLLATWGVSLILRQFVRSVSWPLTLGTVIFCLLFFGGRWLLNRFRSQGPKWMTALILVLSGAIALFSGQILNQRGGDFSRPWFGPRNIDVTPPAWMRSGINVTTGIQLPYTRLFIIALTIICLIGVYWFLQRSAWGLRIRSVTQNRSMSACLGIPTARVDAITFALGSGLAGVAGFAVAMLGSVGPNLGTNYIVDAFMVVVVGGVGKLVGTIVAALGIGIVTYLVGSGTFSLLLMPYESLQPITEFFMFFASTSMAKVMVFALIVLFLQIRPAGLFPQKGRTIDA